jgi:hypothetical protein
MPAVGDFKVKQEEKNLEFGKKQFSDTVWPA